MADNTNYGFATRSIHAGAAPDPVTGARSTPINQATAFVFKDADHVNIWLEYFYGEKKDMVYDYAI